MTALLDVAEACHARKITLGLSAEHAATADSVCTLLYLGFQVAPPRKSPLVDCALTLDLDLAGPALGDPSDHTATGTSDCSTSACEDTGASDSDFSRRVPSHSPAPSATAIRRHSPWG